MTQAVESAASPTAVTLETQDIQGMILSGYGHLNYASYHFLKITEATKAKAWLRDLAGEITNGVKPDSTRKKAHNVNLAVTAPGLRVLGLSAEIMASFALEFQEGMAKEDRARILGDTDDSAPEAWELGGPKNPEIHVLLMLFATDEAGRGELKRKYHEQFAASGLTQISAQDSFRSPGNKEPFGFRDGIAQPGLKEMGDTVDAVHAGEFVMGYTNEYLKMPFTPVVPAALDRQNLLQADAANPSAKDLGRNGTYLVFRKLRQDVDGFWNYMREQSKSPDGKVDESLAQWIAAKCVGRWPSGAPLTLSPDKDDPALGADMHRNNNFMFADKDLKGHGCPMASHIRRSNPRDSLIPNPVESVKMVQRHRIIRRGRVFEDDSGKGIFFLALNANIRRQFEFIQQTWINDRKFDGNYDSQDPLTADADGKGHMVIPMDPVRKRLSNVPRFVQVRGGEYFFMPGLNAIRFLGNL